MVVGLDKFAAHFADYQDRYVLIGVTAAWLVLDEAGIRPRATKDLDIVLYIKLSFGLLFYIFLHFWFIYIGYIKLSSVYKN